MANSNMSLDGFDVSSQLKHADIAIKKSYRVRTADFLDTEFRYYSKLIQDLIYTLSRQEDRDAIIPWVSKLSTPGYNVSKLRDKRNRYMLMLCLSVILDTVEGPFVTLPPTLILPALESIETPKFDPFEWEFDNTWEEQVQALKALNEESEKPPRSKCHLHRKTCPKDRANELNIGKTLDQQFRYLLYISKIYAATLKRSSDRIRASEWIQTLCSIDENHCTISKGIRNDYMMVLCGHLVNHDLVGPFEAPPTETLLPISQAAIITSEKRPITDPTHPKTSEFFMDVPHPEEGAFAFIAATTDLYIPKQF